MEALYIRVSTKDQNTARQGESGYIDKVSGSVAFEDRPAAKKLLRDIEKGKINSVRVHSIDRLGRNTLDILQTVENLTAKGINVISEKEGIQTITNGERNPMAKMLLGILSTLAEFERDRILERQREGIEKAKKRGAYKTNGGRKKQTPEEFFNNSKNATCLRELKRGESIRRAAKLSGMSPATALKVKQMAELYGHL